jgi:hypothetical protein
MTAELEELLAAAKEVDRQLREFRFLSAFPQFNWLPAMRLNTAIRALDAQVVHTGLTDPYDFENDGLRKEP